MKTKIYNKLVRDKIIDIIHDDDKQCHYRILSNEEFIVALKNKLQEEYQEYHESHDLFELADILEVLNALKKVTSDSYDSDIYFIMKELTLLNSSYDELEKIRLDKLKSRGGFSKKIFLISVDDD